MPPGITAAIAQEKRPSAKDRREMVRIIVEEMRLNEPNPSKSQCQTIAKMIVKRRKQKRISNAPEDIARGPVDQYGCVRWQPDCPPGETVESLKEKKSEMKDLYHTEGPASAERGYVIQLMKTTYYLQRKNINACPPPSIAELKTEWPYLFTPREMFSHFSLLTDINILEKMEQAMEEKGKVILRYFQHKTAGTSADEVECILVKYNKEEKCDPWPCVILLLMAHFKEKSEAFYRQM
ncbi:hypothetical protein L3Q82_020911 [Scortum barcoo]|uniref:Uncharacterized protein n=1 Tax=Scortum barcoo TaxID=214431 RepID=A0ACB8V8W9_9TELE|nr:hypothetical protein L3Q82_020911 [Scortum barcoo]